MVIRQHNTKEMGLILPKALTVDKYILVEFTFYLKNRMCNTCIL